MKLLGSTKRKVTKDENGESAPCLETTEVVLVHCNIVKNNSQWYSRAFFPNKSFGQLPNKLYLPKKFIFLKTLNSEFSDIDV